MQGYFGVSNGEKKIKKPYRRPELVAFGSVGQLTMSMTFGVNAEAGGMPRDNSTSDPAVKTNIVRIGEHPAGFGVYLFDYKPEFAEFGHGRQFGVMADEVEKIAPHAVSFRADGYRRVAYHLLGIHRA